MSVTPRHSVLARTCVGLFALSSAFPIAAALLGESRRPVWLGTADVAMAATLFVSAVMAAARARTHVTDQHRIAAYNTSQVVFASIPLLLAVFFIVGGRVDWTVLVVGLAWRGWLLLYTLPFLIALLEERECGNGLGTLVRGAANDGTRIFDGDSAERQDLPLGLLNGRPRIFPDLPERAGSTALGVERHAHAHPSYPSTTSKIL